MSNLNFSSSEIRFGTAALAAVALAIPTIYFIRTPVQKEGNEHVRTFKKLLRGYSSLRPQALVANASIDFTHNVMPLSLELPSRTLEPFQGHAAMIFSLFSNFSMIPQPPNHSNSIQFSPETNTVIAHCKMGGTVNKENEKGRILIQSGIVEWWTECVLFVKMSADGRKIVEICEFVDSAKAGELRKRMEGILES